MILCNGICIRINKSDKSKLIFKLTKIKINKFNEV